MNFHLFISDRKTGVSKRTVSVQTCAEFFHGLYASHDDRSTSPMPKFYEDHFDSPSCNLRYKSDGRLCKSSDNVLLHVSDHSKIIEQAEPSFAFKSQEILRTSTRSLGSYVSLFAGKYERKLIAESEKCENLKKTVPDWVELDAAVLMCDPRIESYYKTDGKQTSWTQTNGKTTNDSASHQKTENEAISKNDSIPDERLKVLRKKRTQIREERTEKISSEGDPVINITITLGTDLSELPQLSDTELFSSCMQNK